MSPQFLEEKLAETASKRPLAVTIGAAVATLVVILAVLTGPALVTCSSSVEGFGACFAGRLADIGILPKPSPVAIAETPQATQPAAPQPDPTPEAAPPSPTTATPEMQTADVAPTFGLLRAEPDGSVVIAGSGTPESEVEILMNGALLGKTKVEASGDWAFVPDAPLPTGGVELTLGQAGSDKQSENAFVVVIDPDHKAEPLVVASNPGQMSEVLQGIDKPAEPPVAVAAIEPPQQAAPQPVEQQSAPEPQAIAEPAPAAPAAVPLTEPPAPAPQANAPVAAASAPPPAAAAPPTAPAVVTAPAPAQIEVAQPPAPSPSAEPAPEIEVATVAPPEPTPAPPLASAPQVATAQPSIDAIEIDKGRNFFAGSGPEGAAVRLYVDSQLIGDSLVAGGRWLIETERDFLNKPAQLVRVDVLKPQSTDVASRAEVNFIVDMSAPSAVAENTAPAATSPAEPATSPVAMPEPPVAAVPPQQPEQSATPSQLAAEEPKPSPGLQPPAEQLAETQSPMEENIPTMVAEPVGDPESQRFASGKAIIRHGDNLWTIARRVYGYGIKYTTIYTANSDQIRDPDRIYPGQVFDLPKSAD